MSVRQIGSSSFRDSPSLGRITCERCHWFTHRPGQLAGHMAAAHPNVSPAVARFRAAAAAGQGVSTESARARRGLA